MAKPITYMPGEQDNLLPDPNAEEPSLLPGEEPVPSHTKPFRPIGEVAALESRVAGRLPGLLPGEIPTPEEKPGLLPGEIPMPGEGLGLLPGELPISREKTAFSFHPSTLPKTPQDLADLHVFWRHSVGLPALENHVGPDKIAADMARLSGEARFNKIRFVEETFLDTLPKSTAASPWDHSMWDSPMRVVNAVRDAFQLGMDNSAIGALTNYAAMNTALKLTGQDDNFDPYTHPEIANSKWKGQWQYFENARSIDEARWIMNHLRRKENLARSVQLLGAAGDVVEFASGIMGDPTNVVPFNLGVTSMRALAAARHASSGSVLSLTAVTSPVWGVMKDTVTNSAIQAGIAVGTAAIASSLDPTQQIDSISEIAVLPGALGAAGGFLSSISNRAHVLSNIKARKLRPGELAGDMDPMLVAERRMMREREEAFGWRKPEPKPLWPGEGSPLPHTEDFRQFMEGNALRNGDEPVMGYHGTRVDFERFSDDKLGSNTGSPSAFQGHFFASNPKVAGEGLAYGGVHRVAPQVTGYRQNSLWDRLRGKGRVQEIMTEEEFIGEGGNVRPTYLRMTNPLIVSDDAAKTVTATEHHAWLKEQDITGFSPPVLDASGNYWAHRLNPEASALLKEAEATGGGQSARQMIFNNPNNYHFAEIDGPDLFNSKPTGRVSDNIVTAAQHDVQSRIHNYNQTAQEAKARGHDGVIVRNTTDGTGHVTDIYIVFDPETQIRNFNERWDISGKDANGNYPKGSVGAALAEASILGDREAEIALNRMVKAGIPLWEVNGITRAAASDLYAFQDAMENLLGSGGLIREKNVGGKVASAEPVDVTIQVKWNKPLVDALRGTQDDWREARTGIYTQQGDHQAAAFAAKTYVSDMFRQDAYTFEAHRRRVGDALWNNGKDLQTDMFSPYVERSAARHRKVYDMIRDEASEVGVFKQAHEDALRQSTFEVKTKQTNVEKTVEAERQFASRSEPTDPVEKQAFRDAHDAAIIAAKKAADDLDQALANEEKLKMMLDKLLKDGPTVNNGESYRPRFYSVQKMLADPDGFKGIIYNHLRLNGVDDDTARHAAETVFKDRTTYEAGYTRADLGRAFMTHGAPGSAMARTLDIPDRLLKDFLENDAEQLLRSHVQKMGSAIEMKRRFGSTGLEEVADEISAETVLKLRSAWEKVVRERDAATPYAKSQAIEDQFDKDFQALLEKRTKAVDYERNLPALDAADEIRLRRAINKIDDQFAADYASLETQKYKSYVNAVDPEVSARINEEYQATWRQLQKERDAALEDVMAARDRIYGTYGAAADPHTWDQRTIRVAKQFANMTLLGLSGVSAMMDLVRPVMTEGLEATYGHGFKSLLSGVRKDILQMTNRELEIAGTSFELPLNLRAASLSDIGDMHMHRTSFERGMNKANSWYFVMNGLNSITQFSKQWAGLTIQGTMNEALFRFAKDGKMMETWHSSRLAGVGIDHVMAKRIGDLIAEHGIDHGNIRLANTTQWGDEVAERAYSVALNQMVNRTVPTPGLGDTPNFMSKPLWGLITQYKSFAMAQLIRTLYSGLQEGSPQFWYGAAAMVGGGVVLNEIRSQLFFDRTTMDKPTAAIIADGMDRSSILGVFHDANRAIETLTGHRAGLKPLLGVDSKPGFDANRMVGSVAGPVASQGFNALNVLYDFASGHPTARTYANARTLLPGQNLPWADKVMDRTVSDGSYFPKPKTPEEKAVQKDKKAAFQRYQSAEKERTLRAEGDIAGADKLRAKAEKKKAQLSAAGE